MHFFMRLSVSNFSSVLKKNQYQHCLWVIVPWGCTVIIDNLLLVFQYQWSSNVYPKSLNLLEKWIVKLHMLISLYKRWPDLLRTRLFLLAWNWSFFSNFSFFLSHRTVKVKLEDQSNKERERERERAILLVHYAIPFKLTCLFFPISLT